MLELNYGSGWFDKIKHLYEGGLVTMPNNLQDNSLDKCLGLIYNRNYDKPSPPFIANVIDCTADRLVICKSKKNRLVSSDQPLRFPCISQDSRIRRKRQGNSYSYIKSFKED